MVVDGHPGDAVVLPWFAGEAIRRWWQATWVLRGGKEKWDAEEIEGVGLRGITTGRRENKSG